MSDEVFEVLQKHPSYTWVCCSCGLPNFSTFFDSSLDLDLSNYVDALKDGDQGDTSLPPSPRSNPLSTSSLERSKSKAKTKTTRKKLGQYPRDT